MTLLASSCQADMADAPSDEELLNWADLVVRAMRNPKLSHVYFRLFLSLIDTYPEILKGQRVPVEVWRVRENAGWAKERVTTNFFQDMNTISAFSYEPGEYSRRAEDRIGYVIATPKTPYPESFDVMNVERKRRAKEAEEKRRKQFQNPLQLFQCEACGSNNLVYDATARCLDCKHEHAPILDIPASSITIDAEVIELAEENPFLDEQTQKVQAVRRPAAVQVELQTPAPARTERAAWRKDVTGLDRPDAPCLKCGRPRRECFENMEGTWWFGCSDEMQRAYAKAKAK